MQTSQEQNLFWCSKPPLQTDGLVFQLPPTSSPQTPPKHHNPKGYGQKNLPPRQRSRPQISCMKTHHEGSVLAVIRTCRLQKESGDKHQKGANSVISVERGLSTSLTVTLSNTIGSHCCWKYAFIMAVI